MVTDHPDHDRDADLVVLLGRLADRTTEVAALARETLILAVADWAGDLDDLWGDEAYRVGQAICEIVGDADAGVWAEMSTVGAELSALAERLPPPASAWLPKSAASYAAWPHTRMPPCPPWTGCACEPSSAQAARRGTPQVENPFSWKRERFVRRCRHATAGR